MAGRLSEWPLALACGDYEIVSALTERKVKAEGIDLNVMTKSGDEFRV